MSSPNSFAARNPYPNLPLDDERAVAFVLLLLSRAQGEEEQANRSAADYRRRGEPRKRHHYDLMDSAVATVARCRLFLYLSSRSTGGQQS